MAALSPGDNFGQMGIPIYGEAPVGDNCAISSPDVPAGGYLEGEEYTVQVTSTTALGQRVTCDQGEFVGDAETTGAEKVLTSSYTWRPTGSGDVVFNAICAAGGEVDQAWIANSHTVARDSSQPSTASLALEHGGLLQWTIDGINIDFSVTASQDGWLGFGLCAGNTPGMDGGGDGTDVVACHSDPPVVQRYWVTQKSTPTGGVDVDGATCTRASGSTVMTFRRPLAGAGNMREVAPGQMQPMVWAFGADSVFGYHGTTRSDMMVDFESMPADQAPAQPEALPAAGEDTATTESGGTSESGGARLELEGGAVLEWTIDGDSIDISVSVSLGTWLGFGLSAGDVVSMEGGGAGTDVVACHGDPPVVQRHWITSKSPGGGVEVTGATCTRASGSTAMTFRRPLAGDGNVREITLGQMQAITWAFGAEGSTTFAYHATRNGMNVDFESGQAADAPKKTGEWTLFLHLSFMTVSWGGLLPWGAAIASRGRTVSNAKPGAWFKRHRALQITGLCGMLIGFVFALYHCQVNSAHFTSPHTFIGAFVVLLGAMQPLNAFVRPHPPGKGEKRSCGRLAFEIVHRGSGWMAVILGMLNILTGIMVIRAKDYDVATTVFAAALALSAMAPVVFFLVLATVMKDNPISKACLVEKGGESAVHDVTVIGNPSG